MMQESKLPGGYIVQHFI